MKQRIDYRLWAGIGISLFFLVLLFRKIDFHRLGALLSTADYRYLLLAIVFTFVSYFMRAVRWKYILIVEKDIALSALYPPTIIGYMANNLLPARLGELVRAYTLASKEQLTTPTVIASLVIDRLCDGFSVMLILVATLFTLDLPPAMREAESTVRAGGLVMFLAYAAIVLFLFLLKRYTTRTLLVLGRLLKPFPASWAERLIPVLGNFIGGIQLSSRSRHLMMISLSSLVIWFFCIIPIDMVLRSFGISLPFAGSMFIMVLLVFAVMVPASPGYVGTYHYACYKGLSAFQIGEEQAMGIAIVIHAVGFFPVILAGFYHLWREKLSFSDMRNAGGTCGKGVS